MLSGFNDCSSRLVQSDRFVWTQLASWQFKVGTFLVVFFVSSSDIASLSLVDGKPVLDPPYASASDGNNSSSSRDENSNVQKAIPEYPVLKLLSGSNATKVHRKLLTGRSRRSYCISEPTSKCSTSCSCPSGSSKLSHSAESTRTIVNPVAGY
eukprot:gene17157-19030_t